jgi:flavin reductase (DIM6/NTAB) family NADH-FMN oxidoreductase RutF
MSSNAQQNGLDRYRYVWPNPDWRSAPEWQPLADRPVRVRELPESAEAVASDSTWPAFFPSSICFVTLRDGSRVALEKVVGASIVNRFPYVVALSFCREELSPRHHARREFMSMLERSGQVAVQFLPQGDPLDRAMGAIASTPDVGTESRIARSGLSIRSAKTNDAPVFDQSYLVYEASLAKPGHDSEGQPIYETPWVDVGSHRVYFLEIHAIQLRDDIAAGRSQIHWRSLPVWRPEQQLQSTVVGSGSGIGGGHYQKPYTPHYSFPSPSTIAFEADEMSNGMAVKYLAALASDQIEVDNDRARWPCFFPSSVGMITSWAEDGTPNLMPCGSTTIVSRQPVVVAVCVSYSAINERYAPRSSLAMIRRTGRFVCGVPFIHDTVLAAIKYAGNVSLAQNPNKLVDAGLEVDSCDWGPALPALPVQFECQVTQEVRLGTHIMLLGEVRRIRIREDVTSENPLEWCPWPLVDPYDPGTDLAVGSDTERNASIPEYAQGLR